MKKQKTFKDGTRIEVRRSTYQRNFNGYEAKLFRDGKLIKQKHFHLLESIDEVFKTVCQEFRGFEVVALDSPQTAMKVKDAIAEKRIAYVIPVGGYVEGKGYNVGIAVEGEKGYNQTDWFWDCDYKTAQKLADEKNERLGLTKREALKIVCSTMF